ncbi:MAG: D-alanyl-D-alanine carboxypeptidase [Erysipelotrichaceae bacterium]|nr:D-alanyl-D-alanine carboxypeptidase [Erysipelotrichaceae bacterium]
MKKWVTLIVIFFLIMQPIAAQQENKTELVQYGKSGILLEASSGKIIYTKNEFEQLHPASMTKMMGMLLIYEQVNKQKIQWDDAITVSEHASSMGGSQIFLEVNETMTLEQMFTAVCISSANDAMVAIAEYIAGTEDGFVQMMNEKVKELKLENTHFSNTTGLDIPNHYSCAYDMAQIARQVLKESKGEVTRFTAMYETYLRQDTDPFWLVNTNKLIRTYDGMDGLKTGFTQAAGYCLTASAKRNGLRMIAVVMKESNKEQRNADIKAMLDYGFSHYEQAILYPKGTVVDYLTVKNGKPEKVAMITSEDVPYIYEKGNADTEQLQPIIQPLELLAPLQKGQIVGHMYIDFGNEFFYEGEITIDQDVFSLDYLDIVFRFLQRFLL